MKKNIESEKAVLLSRRLENNALNQEEAEVFAYWLSLLRKHGLTYAVGGAFAIHAYTGILRNTKDLDIYIKPGDVKKALSVFSEAGYQTDVTDRTWLAKVCYRDYFMDLLFAISGQRFVIGDSWFNHRQSACILDVEVDILAIEELFVSKVFLAKTYRFDGSDIVHLVLQAKGNLDWEKVLHYLGNERELLLWYLLLFNFIYPGRSDYLPRELMARLFDEVREKWKHSPGEKKFRGTLIDPNAFAIDVRQWGYENQSRDEELVDEDGEAR